QRPAGALPREPVVHVDPTGGVAPLVNMVVGHGEDRIVGRRCFLGRAAKLGDVTAQATTPAVDEPPPVLPLEGPVEAVISADGVGHVVAGAVLAGADAVQIAVGTGAEALPAGVVVVEIQAVIGADDVDLVAEGAADDRRRVKVPGQRTAPPGPGVVAAQLID